MMTPAPRPSTSRPLRLAVGVAAVVAMTACGTGSSTGSAGEIPASSPAGAEAASPRQTPTVPAGADDGLLAFTAETVSGETVDVAEYAGRDVAVWFWAPW